MVTATDRKNFDDPTKKYWKLSIRTLALALPNKNKITPRFCKANIPNEYTVSRAALKAKSTPRLNALADYNKNNARKKHERVTSQTPEVFVKRSALKATYSARLDMLSRSPLVKLETTLETYKHVGDHFRMAMRKNINLARTSMYREFYWPKSIPKSESIPKLKSCQYTSTCPPPRSRSATYAELEKWCDENSRPRREYKSEPILVVTYEKKPLAELTKNLHILATPRYVSKKYDPTEADRYSTGVSQSAKSYDHKDPVKSAFWIRMAKPSERQDPPSGPTPPNPAAIERPEKWDDFHFRPVDERLAKPRQRSAGNNDEKEDPFSVNPRAYTNVFCSQRTKELAKPRKR